MTPGRGPATFAYYRPQTSAMTPSGGLVGEVVYVAFPPSLQAIGRKPQPPPPEAVVAAPAGFRLVEQERHEFFTLARLRSDRPLRVTVQGLAAAASGSEPAFFLEPAGAEARP